MDFIKYTFKLFKGCEYEVIVIEQTVEELYDDDQEIQDTAVQDQKVKNILKLIRN